MELPKPSGPLNPLSSLSSFFHYHGRRIGAELASRLDNGKRFAARLLPQPPEVAQMLHSRPWTSLPFASATAARQPSPAVTHLRADYVARRLSGTAVYTVSNSNNEFVLISDASGAKSIGLLCFRHEDAEAFLAQARLRKRELRSGARVVPISLDQVYMLKVEGIAFRFLPDPVQVKNALELKTASGMNGFDGVPVFQSDLLVVKKKNKRFCPIYFRKEDIEQELSKVSRSSRGLGVSQNILVGSLEDVLKKMEMSEKNSGWEDLIFVPPGRSHWQHIQEVLQA